ncbi:hypothetical protein CSA80_01685 [Candidatus Saccharibacteria bacterium]|nr:MAG: hypothetical protein CSA80_01685 [Candidatus Saccharibacteria bacterium]
MSFSVDEIEDLKQLFAANNRMLMAEFEQLLDEKLEEKLEEKFQEKLAPIHQKIDDLAEFVQNAIADSNDANQEQLDDHEERITRLEKAVA